MTCLLHRSHWLNREGFQPNPSYFTLCCISGNTPSLISLSFGWEISLSWLACWHWLVATCLSRSAEVSNQRATLCNEINTILPTRYVLPFHARMIVSVTPVVQSDWRFTRSFARAIPQLSLAFGSLLVKRVVPGCVWRIRTCTGRLTRSRRRPRQWPSARKQFTVRAKGRLNPSHS